MIKVIIETKRALNDARKREARVYRYRVAQQFFPHSNPEKLQISGDGQHTIKNGNTLYYEGADYNEDFKYIDALNIYLDVEDVKRIAIEAVETGIINLSDLFPPEVMENLLQAQSDIVKAQLNLNTELEKLK